MSEKKYSYIALPTRPQPDTIVAIFILKKFGEDKFPGINIASYVVKSKIEEEREDTFLLDVGGGEFDHHSKSERTTASHLVAQSLGQDKNPALSKLLQYAERDDFMGKGTISTDPLDRAFGLSGLIAALNKKYIDNPGQVIESALPLIDAHYTEEEKRAFEMPKELQEKLESGRAREFRVNQRGKKLKCIFIETDNVSMAGFLRSKLGGGYDVVAIKLSSGHINILTKPVQRVDLRSLAVLLRMQEAESRGIEIGDDARRLSVSGVVEGTPNWYYDTATNSLLNGGPNPQGVEATHIDPMAMNKLLEVGLSEQLWSPR